MTSPQMLWHRITERAWDWRIGAQTRGVIDTKTLALPQGSQPYCPIPYSIFFEAMRHVPQHLQLGTYLDLGCGLGRTLILANRYFHFKRIIGVDLSERLCTEAQANTASHSNVSVQLADATQFVIPQDVTVFFLFNPFFGDVLASVIQNIKSWSPGKDFRIVFCNHDHFDKALIGQDWLVKADSGRLLPNITWAIYKPQTLQ